MPLLCCALGQAAQDWPGSGASGDGSESGNQSRAGRPRARSGRDSARQQYTLQQPATTPPPPSPLSSPNFTHTSPAPLASPSRGLNPAYPSPLHTASSSRSRRRHITTTPRRTPLNNRTRAWLLWHRLTCSCFHPSPIPNASLTSIARQKQSQQTIPHNYRHQAARQITVSSGLHGSALRIATIVGGLINTTQDLLLFLAGMAGWENRTGEAWDDANIVSRRHGACLTIGNHSHEHRSRSIPEEGRRRASANQTCHAEPFCLRQYSCSLRSFFPSGRTCTRGTCAERNASTHWRHMVRFDHRPAESQVQSAERALGVAPSAQDEAQEAQILQQLYQEVLRSAGAGGTDAAAG